MSIFFLSAIQQFKLSFFKEKVDVNFSDHLQVLSLFLHGKEEKKKTTVEMFVNIALELCSRFAPV